MTRSKSQSKAVTPKKWRLSSHAPVREEDLSFTASLPHFKPRMKLTKWWFVERENNTRTRGREFAVQFINFINNPNREEQELPPHLFTCILMELRENGGYLDSKGNNACSGFIDAISEYLLTGDVAYESIRGDS